MPDIVVKCSNCGYSPLPRKNDKWDIYTMQCPYCKKQMDIEPDISPEGSGEGGGE